MKLPVQKMSTCERAYPREGVMRVGAESLTAAPSRTAVHGQCPGCVPRLVWGGQLSPNGGPGKAFVMAEGQAWEMTPRFLSRSWTPQLSLL